MKKIFILVITIIFGINIVGCSKNLVLKEVKVVSTNALPSIVMSKLAKEEDNIEKGYKTTYKFEKEEQTKISLGNEEYEIAILPTDICAKVYNKNKNYQIHASIGEGSQYLITTDESVTGFNETLENKEVGIVREGSMIDTTVKSLLNQNNVDNTKVKYKYANTIPELVTKLAVGQIRTGIVPETFLVDLLTKNSGYKVLESSNEAYKKAFDTEYGYSEFSVIIRSDFAKGNEDYIEKFLQKIQQSVDFVNNEPLQAGAYGQEFEIPIKPQLMSRAVHRCNLKYSSVDELKESYNRFFNILYNYNNEAVGGTVPDESIYYT